MNGKRILVTGSSRGIGKAIALYLANVGYEVVLHYNKNITEAEKTLREITERGQKATVLSFDISDFEKTRSVIENDMKNNGVYYGVICNAGVCDDNSFPLMSLQQWNRVVHTNLDGLYNVLHTVVMPMVSQRSPGRIVTVSSVSGIIGNRGQVNYSASKAGIIGATKALAVELAKHKITVNCVAPGIIDTEMVQDLPLEEIKKAIPVRRLGQPKEVASLVAYLLSEDAAYITRQVISVNGGLI